ncbi:MAG: CPBP family intramembrane metalloprotease [Lachnospiraceae bacterium]|nr:CPBP family intramembrane metalloprotease [Lachnospiraceae bacterium]
MLSSLFVDMYVDHTLTTIVNENSVIINLIIIALIPAIVEEFIFRGVIFNSYKKRNPFGAVLLSAFLFGLVHMNVNQFSYAFVIGVIFALLTYATGSIIPSIIAHFVINGNSVVMSHLLTYIQKGTQAVTETGSAMTPVDKLNEEYGMLSEAIVYAVVIGTLVVMSIIGCLVAFFIFRYICKKNRGIESVKMIFKKNVRNTYVEEEGKFFDEYLWLGIGVCLVYIILYDFIL